MRLCAIDLETNGLDFESSWITEIGYVIKDYGSPKPLVLGSHAIAPDADIPAGHISEEITQITGITEEHLREVGVSLHDALEELCEHLEGLGVQYMVTHNGQNFDEPMLAAHIKRLGLEDVAAPLMRLPWLDTQHDVVYPKHWQRNLVSVAANHGFLNPFPHAALFDAYTCFKVLEYADLEQVIARSKMPWVVLRALVTPPYDDPRPAGQKESDLAKARRFGWQSCGDGRVYEKMWVKRVKEDEVAKEMQEAPIKIVRLGDAV